MEPEESQTEEIEEIVYSEDRSKKILILEFYLMEFPKKLEGYKEIVLQSLTLAQLDALKEEFTFVISTQSNVNYCIQTFSQAIVFTEAILCTHTPIQAQGLSLLLKDPALIDDIKAWSLENIDLIRTKPEHRILSKVLSSIVLLHNANSKNNITNISSTSTGASTSTDTSNTSIRKDVILSLMLLQIFKFIINF